MTDSISDVGELDFKLLASGQYSKTITEQITRNTFVTHATVDVSKIPVGRLYPLIYAVDQSGNFLSRDLALMPNGSFTVTSDGTAGGLAVGTLISCFPEWRINNGTLQIGFCPPKWSGAASPNFENLKAPYVQAYYVWFIFYV